MRHLKVLPIIACLFCFGFAQAAEPSASDEAIAESIVLLEARKAQIDDPLEQAKIAKAIEELESMLDEAPKAGNVPAVGFEVKPSVLRKKFQGRSAYNVKTGELALIYDFSKKEQLRDFEGKNAKPIVANKGLFLDGSDHLSHIAKFKSFTVTGVIAMKSMNGGGVGSSNGSHIGLGGNNHDTLFMNVTGGPNVTAIVPAKFRTGTVPFQLSINSSKTAVRLGSERLTNGTAKKDDTHQVEFDGGTEGYAFSNIVIIGVPEPKWFKEFLEAK